MISICDQYIDIKFSNLTANQPLYYEFRDPYVFENVTVLNASVVVRKVNISFKGVGSEKIL